MTSEQLHWVAGLMEGEACFGINKIGKYRYPRIQLVTSDLDVLERFKEYVGSGNISGPHASQKRKSTHSDTWRWSLQGGKAHELMIQVLPIMGKRRSMKIRELLEEVGISY